MQIIIIAVVLLIIVAMSAVHILQEYERGVVFFLGRLSGVRGPGLVLIIPFVERIVRVDQRTITMDIPAQDVITKDNVSIKVNAVLYFRALDIKGDRPGRKLPLRHQSARPDDAAERVRRSRAR